MFCTAQCSHCRDSAAEWQISVEIHSFPFLEFSQSWGKEEKEEHAIFRCASTCSLAHPTAFRDCCLLLFSAHAYILRLSLILTLKSLDHSFSYFLKPAMSPSRHFFVLLSGLGAADSYWKVHSLGEFHARLGKFYLESCSHVRWDKPPLGLQSK